MFRKLLPLLLLAMVLGSIGLTVLVFLSPYLTRSAAVAVLHTPVSPSPTSIPPTATAPPTPTVSPTPTASPTLSNVAMRSVTDASGRTIFQDPVLRTSIGLRVLDAGNNKPLPNISTFVFSQGQELLIVAVDPQYRYLVTLQQITHRKLESGYQPGRKLAMLAAQTSTDVYITMQPTSSIKTANDWLARYGDAPDLDHWGLATRDECIDADQIVTGIKKVGEAPIALLPFPAQILTDAQTAPVADWAWLALNANLGSLDRAPFREKLAALNAAGGGVLRVRTYQLDSTSISTQRLGLFSGWCLEPIDHKNPDSLLKWLEYGTQRGDGYVLGQLTANPPFDVLLYGPYRAEGQGTLNRETLIREARASGLGKVKCMGYSTYRAGERVELFEVVTGDWTPGWDTWQARGMPFAVFAFMPTRRSAGSLETTEGLYLNYLGVPQKSDIEQGFAKCPDLLGP